MEYDREDPWCGIKKPETTAETTQLCLAVFSPCTDILCIQWSVAIILRQIYQAVTPGVIKGLAG